MVVIDFEYVGVNILGFEFVNYFFEWIYDYYDVWYFYVCDIVKYFNVD